MYFPPAVAPSCFSKVGAKLYGAAVVRLVHANHEVVVVRTVLVGARRAPKDTNPNALNDQVNVAAIVLTMVFGGLTAEWFHGKSAEAEDDDDDKLKKN